LAPCVHQFAVIANGQQQPVIVSRGSNQDGRGLYAAKSSPFPTRLPACCVGLNGLTASSQWHRIYRSQQSSLSLGKGLMLTNRR